MPVFPFGSEPARIEYGIERMLAHATPTPAIETSSMYLSRMNATDKRPIAPIARHIACVSFRPKRFAIDGNANENPKHTAEYIAKQLPPHAMPASYSFVPGSPWKTLW